MSIDAYLEGLSLLGWDDALALYNRHWAAHDDARQADDREAQIDAYERAEAILSFSLQQMTPPNRAAELMLSALVERHWPEEDHGPRPAVTGAAG